MISWVMKMTFELDPEGPPCRFAYSGSGRDVNTAPSGIAFHVEFAQDDKVRRGQPQCDVGPDRRVVRRREPRC